MRPLQHPSPAWAPHPKASSTDSSLPRPPPLRAGAWRQGYSTDIYLIHANVMKDGRVVGWCSVGKFGWGSVVCDPARPGAPPKCERLLGECGIHDW